jgi:hypothetical protein
MATVAPQNTNGMFYPSCSNYDSNYYNNYGDCYSTWNDWGRWVALAVIVVAVLLIAFLFSYVPFPLPFPPTPSNPLFTDAITTVAVAAWAPNQCTAPAGFPAPSPHNTDSTTKTTTRTNPITAVLLLPRTVLLRWETRIRARRSIVMRGIMVGIIILRCSRRRARISRNGVESRFMRRRWDRRLEKLRREMESFGRRYWEKMGNENGMMEGKIRT